MATGRGRSSGLRRSCGVLISESYRALNEQLHAKGNYGVSGAKWAPLTHRLAGEFEARAVLDYGCGQGTLKQALKDGRWSAPIMQQRLPYDVLEYDPAIPGKGLRPLEADLVVCGDVLEHIEPECLDAVLDDIADVARKAALLVVATRPAKKFLADGRNAHLIVQPSGWWLPKILCRWTLRNFNSVAGEFMCVVTK